MNVLPHVTFTPISSAPDCIPEFEYSSFLQSKFWGLFKARTGWQAYSCSYDFEDDGPHGNLLVLRRKIAKFLSFLYVPHGGGELSRLPDRWNALSMLGRALGESMGKSDAFVRFDLPWERMLDEKTEFELTSGPTGSKRLILHKGTDVQVADTVVLDLAKSTEELLSGMKPKWRYNIRLSEKKGIQVTKHGKEGLPLFMKLYAETAKRDKIAIHPESYYATLFDTVLEVSDLMKEQGIPQQDQPILSLYIAHHESDALAGIIVLKHGPVATYMYGASSNLKRNMMPAYALQWHAIQESKEQGARMYDFFGIPPQGDDASHAMSGLYLFKTGFGGKIIHRYGAWDVPIHPWLYAIFRSAEKMRAFWHKKVKKSIRKISPTASAAHPSAGERDDSEKTNPSNP